MANIVNRQFLNVWFLLKHFLNFLRHAHTSVRLIVYFLSCFSFVLFSFFSSTIYIFLEKWLSVEHPKRQLSTLPGQLLLFKVSFSPIFLIGPAITYVCFVFVAIHNYNVYK